jgi:hypothetical protein
MAGTEQEVRVRQAKRKRVGIRPTPPVEVLEQWLYEEPEGVLRWRKDYAFGHWVKLAGTIAGTNANQRIFISLFGNSYLRSRLIWKMHRHSEPPREVEHKNRNTLDDRIENLKDKKDKTADLDLVTKNYLNKLKADKAEGQTFFAERYNLRWTIEALAISG